MKPIASKDCNVGGVFYEKGDEIEIKDKDLLVKLNELGFIEPLTPKQIQDFGKISRIIKKEE